jgi:hypothetical protein
MKQSQLHAGLFCLLVDPEDGGMFCEMTVDFEWTAWHSPEGRTLKESPFN